MGKLLGIDYGMKRTGLAITDDYKIIASPLTTVDTKDILPFLEVLCKKEPIEAIVLGEPKYLNGTESEMTKNVHAFKLKLEKLLPQLKIHLEDEFYTSKIAADTMVQAGYKKKDRRDKRNLDKISAALILQSFMERL
jgi:putative Holliday junction resolvase